MDHHYHYYTNGISHRREVVTPTLVIPTPTLMIPKNWIDRILPKELLLKILSYLDIVSLCRCAQVSKYWNQSALDGSNWHTVDLFFFQTDIEGPVIENLSRRCGGFLKSLSLRGCQSVTDASLRQFAMNCQNIVSLNLNGCTRIADGTCQSLSQYCHRLTKLDLESCSNITDTSLIAISAGCTNLISICISWCNRVTDEGLHHLLRKCSKLQTFIAKGCPQLTCIGFKHLGFCPELRTINLHGCMNMTDMTITKISEGCPNLTSLCISKCSRLTDASLIHLSRGCHELRTLEVASCVQFSDNGFQALAKNCHNLQRLDLEECIAITDATIGHLALNCPRLSELTLSHCENITDEGIGQLGGSLCAAEMLTVVELDNCPLVSDVSLLHLHGCQNLQRIELYDCQLVTRSGIHKLKCHLPNIKVHAYFAPATPPPSVGAGRRRLCRCCVIL